MLNEAVGKAFAGYDAIVHPTRSTVSYPVGIKFEKAYPAKYNGVTGLGSPGNLAGLPEISVPNGFGDHNLPTGLAMMGRAWGEMQITQIAKAYQARTKFHTMHPKLVVV